MKITVKELQAIIVDELHETLEGDSVGLETVLEKRMREAELTGGKKTKFGSKDHVKDLEDRINELDGWRQKHKKGSEHRANYSRVINKLKNELGAAKKHTKKHSLKEDDVVSSIDKDDKSKLAFMAKKLWHKAKTGNPLSREEKARMLDAYKMNALPKDPDHDPYKWVKDGFPMSEDKMKKSGRALHEGMGFDVWKNKVVVLAARLLNTVTVAVEKMIRGKDFFDELVDAYSAGTPPPQMAQEVAQAMKMNPAFAEGIITGNLKDLMMERPLEQLPPKHGDEVPDAVAAVMVTQLVEVIGDGAMTRSAQVMLDSLGDDIMIPTRYEDISHYAEKVVEMVAKDPEFKDALFTLAHSTLKHLMEPV